MELQRPHFETYNSTPGKVPHITLLPRNFSASLAVGEGRIIDEEWEALVSEQAKVGNKPFSSPRTLATFLNVKEDGSIECEGTEFREYSLISRSSQGHAQRISAPAYERMRVAAVGGYVITEDNNILVHRRSSKATHVAGFVDSSCAGLCKIRGETIDPLQDLTDKMEREIGLLSHDIASCDFTGLHSCGVPDFSGMFAFGVRTTLYADELSNRIREVMGKQGTSTRFDGYEMVKARELIDYVDTHLIETRDMVGDGAMTLMAALDPDERQYLVSRMGREGLRFQRGTLREGLFTPAA